MESGDTLEVINAKHPYRCDITDFKELDVSNKCTHSGFVEIYISIHLSD